MTQIATEFLSRCFAPGETIALLLRRDNAERTAQRVVRLEQALAPAYLRWLAHENVTDANVYVAANPLRSGSRRRTKECIASVRHLYIDIDSDGDARIAALRDSDAVPVPSAILSTSPGKYQVLWRVDGFEFEQQESTLKQLASAFGGDPACTDCNRVIRVPGFLNQKYSPAHFVAVEYPCDSVWNPDDFQLDMAVLPLRGIARPLQPGNLASPESSRPCACHSQFPDSVIAVIAAPSNSDGAQFGIPRRSRRPINKFPSRSCPALALPPLRAVQQRSAS